jgi:Zn-dependent peptidase ImmA (M78 family)
MANFAKAIQEAQRMIEEFGFSAPPINPVTLARDLGIKLWFVKLGEQYQNVSGFYDAAEDAIYVSKDEYPKRQTFTIAHELGHRVLHREWAASNDYRVLMRDQHLKVSDEREQEANAFAAHLLVPTKMLARYRHVASVEELSDLFVVSMPVVRNRLNREFRSR